jgi:hypothetical protein
MTTQSDNERLDRFFRAKEQEWQPDTGGAAANWQAMQQLLPDIAVPDAVPQPPARPLRNPFRYIAIAASLTAAVLATVLIVNNRQKIIPDQIGQAKNTPVNTQNTITNPNTHDSTVHNTISSLTNTTSSASGVAALADATDKKAKSAALLSTSHLFNRADMQLPSYPDSNQINAYLLSLNMDSLIATNNAAYTSAAARDREQLDHFYRQIAKPAQEYTLNGSKDTSLRCYEGTEVGVPAGAFVTNSGRKIRSEIKLQIEEYYRLSDMIAAKLSTTSNGDLLVTGGMLKITATLPDGEPLQLQRGYALDIRMPTNRYDDAMQLFTAANNGQGFMIDTPGSGSPQVINWMPAGQPQERWWWRPRVTVKPKNEYVETSTEYADTYTQEWKVKKKYFVIRRGDNRAAVRKLIRQREPGDYKIKLRKFFNKKKERDYFQDSLNLDFADAYLRHYISREDSVRYASMMRPFSAINHSYQLYADKYRFRIEQLGWINCDHFHSDSRPKLDYVINFESRDPRLYHAQLIFPRINAVVNGTVQGNKMLFPRVPEGEPAIFVSIGTSDKTIFSSFTPLTIAAQEMKGISFEATNAAAFKEKASSVNTE